MKIENLKVSFLQSADKSDPANVLLTVAAKAMVDGVLCGWRACVIGDSHEASDRAVAILIARILKNPRNALEITGLPAAEDFVSVIIPDVEIAEGMVA